MEQKSYRSESGPETADVMGQRCLRVFGAGATVARCELPAGHESGHCAPLPPGLRFHHVVWLPGDPRERTEPHDRRS